MKKKILMVVNTQIQKDARVLRAARALNKYSIDLLSMNGDISYHNDDFMSLIYTNHKAKGFFLNVSFWFYIISFCLKHRKEYDLFYFHDYPIVIAGRIAALLCRKKWVYDAHELLLNHKNVKNSWKRNFFVYLERISIRHADLVVAANDERERIIKFVYKLKNTTNVKNIADLQIELPEARLPYIVYQGAIYVDRNLHPFIDALSFLEKEVHLKIVGGGDVDHYKKYVKDKSLGDRVIFTGGLPYSELMKQSVCAKVGIIVYKMEGLNYIYCEPNKIYEYAQARLPMLVSPQPKLKHLVTKYHMGEVLDYPLNAKDVAVKTRKIWDDYDSYLVGIEKFVKDYTFENEKKKLCQAVARIVDK